MARKMKDSGIEWIGEIPEGWETQKLKYYATVTSGEILSRDEYDFSGDIPVIGSNGKIGTTYKSNNHSEVITTGRVGTIGTAQIVQDAWITDNALIIKSHSINRPFLAYVIPNFDFKFMLSGTAQPLITATKLKNQYIPVPSSEVQDKLVQYLNTQIFNLSHLISQACSSIELYKKLKQAVITQAVTKGVRGEREMKDSGVEWIGKVPSKWNCIKIKYLFEIRKRIAGKEGYTVLSITQTGIKPKNISSNEGQLADSYSNYQLLHFGEFAMNHMDLLTGWVDISNYNGVTSPDYRVFSLKDTITNHPRYFLYLMQMCYFNRIFYSMAQGVSNLGRWRLQSDKFLNCIFPVPSIEEQKEISDYLDTTCSEIDKLIAKKEQLVKELESYKKSLIYEVVTGKRKV